MQDPVDHAGPGFPTEEQEEPAGPSWFERHRYPLIAAGIIAISLFVAAARGYQLAGVTADDAYASLRYASHLAGGDGLVWNRGEHPATEGYASLLWVLLMAIPLRLGADPLAWARVIDSASFLLSAMLIGGIVVRLARQWIPPGIALLSGATAFALLLLHASPPVAAMSGLGTGLAAIVLMVTLLAAGRATGAQRPFAALLACITGILAFLLRTELFFACAAALACTAGLAFNRRDVVRFSVYPMLVALLFYDAWRMWHAWMVFPLAVHIRLGRQMRILAGADTTIAFLIGAAPLIVCALPLVWFAITRQRTFLPAIAAVAALAFCSLFIIPSSFEPQRLLETTLPLLALGAGLGLALGFRRVPERWIAPAVFLLLLSYLAWQTDRFTTLRTAALEHGRIVRNGFVLFGKALSEVDAEEGYTLAIGGSDAAAYSSGWKVIDTRGEHNRAVALGFRGGAYDPGLVLNEEPDLLITASRKPKSFDPAVPTDGPLYEQATRNGYRRLGAVRISDSLYLWLLSSGSLGARTISSAVERHTTPLIH